MKKILTTATLLLTLGFAANAQTPAINNSSASQTLWLDISDIIDLSFTSPTPTYTFQFPTLASYTDGAESPEQELKVITNRQFMVDVKTQTAYIIGQSTAHNIDVTNALFLKVTNSAVSPAGTFSNYTPLSLSPQTILDNHAVFTGTNTFKIKYQAKPGTAHPKDSYRVDVMYTATHK